MACDSDGNVVGRVQLSDGTWATSQELAEWAEAFESDDDEEQAASREELKLSGPVRVTGVYAGPTFGLITMSAEPEPPTPEDKGDTQ